MQLINNDELNITQVADVSFLGQHHCEAFGCGQEEMSTVLSKICPNPWSGIAGSKMNRPFFFQAHAHNRSTDVFLDVVGKRAQRRDIDALNTVERFVPIHLPQEKVENAKKAGQSFAAAGR